MMALKQSTHGFDPLAYMGTPFTPAAVYIQEDDPLPKNQAGIPLGTLWINLTTRGVFFLVAKEYNPITKKVEATWLDILGVNQIATDAGTAFPVAGIVNILGGLNINTAGAGNTVTINLDDTVHISGQMFADQGFTTTAGNLNLPNTAPLELAGVINFNNLRYMTNYGDNLFVGRQSGTTTLTVGVAENNIGIGKIALFNLVGGFNNVMVGDQVGHLMTNGEDNSALGFESLWILTTGNHNTALGSQAASQLVTGSNNIALGYQAGISWTTNDSNNIAIGSIGVAGDNGVIILGDDAIHTHTVVAGNLLPARSIYLSVADNAGANGYIYSNDLPVPTRILSMPGLQNLFLGQAAGSVTPVFVNAQSNVGIGPLSMTSIRGGIGNTAVGANAGAFLQNGIHSTLVGQNAGNSIVNNIENVCIGYEAGNHLAAGDLNVFVGSYAGEALTGNAGTVGNTALGHGALRNSTGGSANLCLGGLSGQNLTTNESNNVLIQSNGVVGRSREIRIGTTFTGGAGDGQQSKCWIAAIRGVTTDVADAIPVLIDSTGQLGTISSSERYKDDIEDMGAESDMIMALRPVTFTYKSDASKRQQFGLIAEEVADLFPKLVVYDEDGLPDTIRYHELPVLLLNELQKYAMVIENLKERIEVLERSIQ